MPPHTDLPISLPPRLLRREQAAAYLSISAVTFDKLVAAGQLPPPRWMLARKVWLVPELDIASDNLPVERERGGS